MRIHSVQAQILSTACLKGAARYEDTAGLRFPGQAPSTTSRFTGRNDKRHLCVYPQDRLTVLVRVESEDGTIGFGEAHAPVAPRVVCTIIDDLLAPIVIGEDLRQIAVLWERMFSAMRLRSHTQGFMLEAIAGIDIALWDLLGKLRGEPIWLMLGGAYRRQLPVYCSGTAGATVDEKIASIRKALADGFTVVKSSCGRAALAEEMAMVRSLSEAMGERGQILVDAHGAYDLPDALRFAHFLEELGNVGWLEDPLVPEDRRGYAALTQATFLRIAMGETECNRYGIRERLTNAECDLLLPDVCRAGGISETQRIAQLADVFGVSWASHVSTSTPIHLMAGLHVGAATPNFYISELPNGFAQGPFGNVLLREPIAYQNGAITLSDAPGLGLEVDETEIGRLRLG